MEKIIYGYVDSVRGHSMGDRTEKLRVEASYESANTLSTITFDIGIEESANFYVGKKLMITIED